MDATLATLKKTVATKSIADLVKAHSQGLAITGVTLVLDVSGSMNTFMANNQRRIDGLREVVRQVQAEAQVAMVAFGGRGVATFVTTVPDPIGGTPFAEGLACARDAGVSRVICVSDGEPNDELEALRVGKELGRCDCVFVGNSDDRGREFMARLAAETGGTMFDGDLAEVKALVVHICGLLGDGGHQ